MTDFQTIEYEVSSGVATVTLNRPDVHNAFDDRVVPEMTEALKAAGGDAGVRCVVLTGAGASFSAGADLNWMQRMVDADEEANKADALDMAGLLRALNFLPKPTIARINGSAFGGGVGLIACCDIAVAAEGAKFGLTEVKLGLVPAVISPYVIDAIGQRQARRLFQSGEVLDAEAAKAIGLIHSVVSADGLDDAVRRQCSLIGEAGPQAVAAAKALVFAVQGGRNEDGQKQIDQATAALIARLRVSEEGQEGLMAFLEKRSPTWR
ncbi:MAG: enoyl-CoA hydratase/isomerase family protein [Xanthomonadales bacterium]|nr:enoyl-CoA hydratase/isomerase family protein [Xanthomonadales bacterium]